MPQALAAGRSKSARAGRSTCTWTGPAKTAPPGNHFQVVLDDKIVLEGEVLGTGTWDEYRQQKFGQIHLDPGAHRLEFRSAGAIKNALIDLRTVILVPETGP